MDPLMKFQTEPTPEYIDLQLEQNREHLRIQQERFNEQMEIERDRLSYAYAREQASDGRVVRDHALNAAVMLKNGNPAVTAEEILVMAATFEQWILNAAPIKASR